MVKLCTCTSFFHAKVDSLVQLHLDVCASLLLRKVKVGLLHVP
jgi:hypothetical protein